MDSINALNYSGIQAAESISESAKQNMLLAEQLANQKKAEINEPLNMLGAELLTGTTKDALARLGKSVSKRTGITSFENLGKEDLAKTLKSVGRELQSKAVKKGSKIIGDKLGSKIDDLLTRGKEFALKAINKQLSSKGIDFQLKEDDLNNIENLKDLLRQKSVEFKAKAENTVKNKLAEKGQELQKNVNSVAEKLDTDSSTVSKIQDDITKKYGKASQAVSQKVEESAKKTQSALENTSKRVQAQAKGRDTGAGIDDEDIQTQKILGDIQEGKGKALLKQKATEHYKFNDDKIESIGRSIDDEDDLPLFSKSTRLPKSKVKPVGEPEELTQPREVSLFDASNQPFEKKFKNNIQAEATLDDQDNIENTYRSLHTNAIAKSQRSANPISNVQDDTPNFMQPKVTESQYLDQLPSVQELTETPEQKILRQRREKVDIGIQQQEENDLGKKPSQLFSKDPKVKDPTTLKEGDSASLGKTSGKVPAKREELEFTDDEEEDEYLERSRVRVLEPKFEPAPKLITPAVQDDLPAKVEPQVQIEPETEVTEQNVNQGLTKALEQKAPLVQKSETEATPRQEPKIEEDLKKGEADLGESDLLDPTDIFGDIGEGLLGIASLILPSLLEKGNDMNQHNPLFSSSFQAGETQ